MVIVGEDGKLQAVVDRNLNTPGNWRAILTLRLKNLETGNVVEKRFKPEDKVEQAYLDKRPMQYLYQEGGDYVFMDKETFDQVTLKREDVGELILYLKENDDAQVTLYQGKPISLEPPAKVQLRIEETAPGMKGLPGAAQYKPAKLETGLEISVPLFVEPNELVEVDTRTGEYLGRVK
jgi:elongation factor P